MQAISNGPFTSLASSNNCGFSPIYSFSAHYNIHPTYIQSLISRGDDSKNLSSLVHQMALSDAPLSTYVASNPNPVIVSPPRCQLPFDSSAPLLVIGSAKLSPFMEEALSVYRRTSNCTTLAINSSFISHVADFIDFRFCINPARIKYSSEVCKSESSTLITCANIFDDNSLDFSAPRLTLVLLTTLVKLPRSVLP